LYGDSRFLVHEDNDIDSVLAEYVVGEGDTVILDAQWNHLHKGVALSNRTSLVISSF
jgi:hypothetical protein